MTHSAEKKPQGVILRGGCIETLAPNTQPLAAIGILNGKIAAVGSLEKVRSAIPDPAEQIDLDGATVLPGFHDAYTRLFSQSERALRLNLYSAANLPEILALVEKAVNVLGKREWIIGHGWDKSLWTGNRFPHRADIDLIAPHHRVALFSTDPRIVWLNSEGLRATGIKHDTPDPPGGEIERDPITHAATGILKEEAVRLLLPVLPECPADLLTESLMDTIAKYHARGITSIQDISPWHGIQQLAELRQSGKLYIRVWSSLDWDGQDLPLLHEHRTGDGDFMFQYGHLAFPVDGTIQSHTAARPAPYESDYDNQGLIVYDIDRLRELMQTAQNTGWQVRLRTSADVAIGVIQGLTQSKLDPSSLLLDLPVMVNPDAINWLKTHQLPITLGAYTMSKDWAIAAEEWPDDLESVFPLAEIAQQGIPLQIGTNYPVEYWSMLGLIGRLSGVGLNHTNPLHPVWSTEHALSVRQAIEALTVNPAKNLGRLQWSGTLEEGKVADLVVLSDNPLTQPADKIKPLKVMATMVSGNWVYADGFQVRLSRAMRRMLERLAASHEIDIPD